MQEFLFTIGIRLSSPFSIPITCMFLQIAEENQWELCGQLVGVLKCFSELVDSPTTSIVLQHSRFAIRHIDKFIIVSIYTFDLLVAHHTIRH